MNSKEFLENVRESAEQATWNAGVACARASSVLLDASRSGGAREAGQAFQVIDPKSQLARRVELWLDDGDWHCKSCSDDPCLHIVAAAIAWHQKSYRTLEADSEKADVQGVRYQLERLGGTDRVVLKRRLAPVGASSGVSTTMQEIKHDLNALKGTKNVLLESLDFEIDQFLLRSQSVPSERWNRGHWLRLMPLLKEARSLEFEGEAIQISLDKRGLSLLVQPEGLGLRLALRPEASVRAFEPGLVLIGNTLHPATMSSDDPLAAELVGKGKIFSKFERARCEAEWIPRLLKQFPMHADSRGFRAALQSLAPQLVLQHEWLGAQGLRLHCEIHYGSPPIAVVDADGFRAVGDPLCERFLETEAELAAEARKRFGLELGIKRSLDAEAALDFVAVLRSSSRADTLDPALLAFQRLGRLKAEAQLETGDGAQLALRFRLENGNAGLEDGVTFDAVWQAHRRGHRFLDLGAGRGLLEIPGAWLSRFGQRIVDFNAKSGASTRGGGSSAAVSSPAAERIKAFWLLDELGVDAQGAIGDLERFLDERRRLEAKSKEEISVELPHGFRPTLRPYQKTGVAYLQAAVESSIGVLLADDMGLGKTIQAIAVLKKASLVVAPASLLRNWEAEIARHHPNLKVSVFHGKDRVLDADADVVIASYGMLRANLGLLSEQQSGRQWDLVVLDEAQTIKNPESQVAQCVFALKAKCRVALTGTPIENQLEEVWSLFRFLNPGMLGSYEEFTSAQRLSPDAAVLGRRLKPFILRRRKEEVLKELPPKTLILKPLTLSTEESSAYEAEASGILAAVGSGELAEMGVPGILNRLMRLRRTACDVRLSEPSYRGPSTKIEFLLEVLPELIAEGHRALIFSQWTSFLDLLEAPLRESGHSFLRLDGTTRDRQGVVEAFGRGEADLMLMSLKAGGVGLNLTAADHVFLLDPWWNQAAEEQAFARAHRMGQERPVFVYKLIAAGTIEEQVLNLQAFKQGLFDDFLAGTEEAAEASALGHRGESSGFQDRLKALIQLI